MQKSDPHANKGRKLGRAIGSAVGGAIDAAFDAAEHVGQVVLSPLGLPGVGKPKEHERSVQPGERPGIESEENLHVPPPPGSIRITCIDYGPEVIRVTDVEDIEAQLLLSRPEGASVRWINVDGLHPHIVHRFMQAYGLHTLAAEDVLHTPQRPKMDPYENELFIIVRMLGVAETKLVAEQVSLFYRPDLIVSFQERPGDVWEPIRKRMDRAGSRLRDNDASFLLYALLDAIVDHCFPILEQYGDILEDMETDIANNPDPKSLRKLHGIKRQLVQLRRVLWPMREAIGALLDEDLKTITPMSRTYLRDVQDHATQVIDIIETYREMAAGLTDLYMSAVSNRMNEVMKVLTIIATLFIPITFIAGVYGMNMSIPELEWKGLYPTFWILCITVTLVLLYYFKRKGWIGK